MRAVALYGTLGSLLLTATVVTAPAEGTPGPPAGYEAGTARAAARAAAAGIDFGRCPGTEQLPAPVECGTVEVPLDYARPDGTRIRLTVSRTKAGGDPAERRGALVYNPGGPGGSGMAFPLAATLPDWRRYADAYDLVGYAPRGVGRSAPLSCQDPRNLGKGPTQSPAVPSPAYKRERIAKAKAYAEGCARRSGPALAHYHSLNNARDLDVLRAALGERKLTFMGASYGTYFGAVYASLFPSHVRRMVFDSVVDPRPEQIWYRNNLDQSAAFEGRWADFRAWVARHDDVYHLGRTPRKVHAAYEKVRAELAGKPAGGVVGPGQLQSAYLQTGYSDSSWPRRAMALAEYVRGNPKPLIEQAAPRKEGRKARENGSAVYTAVECNDAPWPTDWAVWDRDNTALARRAPFETWDNAWTNLPCAFWEGPRQRPHEVRTAPGELPPVLILAAERDAATPYRGALELHRRLPGSVLVTERDAGTHGVAGGTNGCVNRHLEAYLLEDAPPAHNTVCAGRAEPEPDTAPADTAPADTAPADTAPTGAGPGGPRT